MGRRRINKMMMALMRGIGPFQIADQWSDASLGQPTTLTSIALARSGGITRNPVASFSELGGISALRPFQRVASIPPGYRVLSVPEMIAALKSYGITLEQTGCGPGQVICGSSAPGQPPVCCSAMGYTYDPSMEDR